MRPQSLGEAGPTPGADAKSDAGDVRALIEQAQRLVNDGDASSARALVDKIAPRLQQSVDPAATADALEQLGALQSKLANHAVALQHCERAQALWHEAGDAAREARAWLAVGDARRALNRLPKAIEAYRAAALAGAKLDDPLVQAHAAFKLGHLAAARSPEATQQELTRAASLYAEADVRAGTSGLRIANPHLPDRVDDLDAIEPWIMSKVAERDLQRLLNATETVRQEKAVEVKATAHKPAAHNEWIHAGIILGGVTLVFIGVILLSRFLPAWSIRAEKVPFLLIAPVAGVIAWFLVRSSDILPRRSSGVPIAVALLVYIGGFLAAGHNPRRHGRIDSGQPSMAPRPIFLPAHPARREPTRRASSTRARSPCTRSKATTRARRTSCARRRSSSSRSIRSTARSISTHAARRSTATSAR
jgi:tetratricopeptide (TPR) repeat protein